MMTDEQRIEWLLELQDHPEQLTDAQLQQILADDEMRQLVQQLGFAKRAFKHDALKNDTPDVDAEWEKFAASHAEELEILDEGERLRVGDGTSGIHKPRFVLRLATHKIAASFIGVLLVSGTEQVIDTKPVTSLPADTVKTDTIPTEPYVFNNVPLDSMLTAIATAHGVGVEFENEAARELRFHFVWKREDSLSRVVEKLNTFEAVNIGMEDKTLVVK